MYGLAVRTTELGRVEMNEDIDGTLYIEHWDVLGNITTCTKARGKKDAVRMFNSYIDKYL